MTIDEVRKQKKIECIKEMKDRFFNFHNEESKKNMIFYPARIIVEQILDQYGIEKDEESPEYHRAFFIAIDWLNTIKNDVVAILQKSYETIRSIETECWMEDRIFDYTVNKLQQLNIEYPKQTENQSDGEDSNNDDD